MMTNDGYATYPSPPDPPDFYCEAVECEAYDGDRCRKGREWQDCAVKAWEMAQPDPDEGFNDR